MKNKLVHTLLVLFFAMAVVSGRAQFEVGVVGGVSIPNLTASGSNTNPLNNGYSSRLGPEFGITAEYFISPIFSLEGRLLYSSQGGKKNGLQAFTTPPELAGYLQSQGMEVPTYLFAHFKSEAQLNYLRIPLLAKTGYDLGQSHFRFSVAAGPFVGFLLDARQVTSGNSEVYVDPAGTQALPTGSQSFDHTTNIKDQLHKANFGMEANIGLAYALGFGGNSKILLEAGGNYGFANIQKGTANGKNKTGAATLLLGYAYRFRY